MRGEAKKADQTLGWDQTQVGYIDVLIQTLRHGSLMTDKAI